MRRILFLPKYSRLGASSRYRVYQFLDRFRAAGFECDVFPLLSDEYAAQLYTKRPAAKSLILRSLVGRLGAILRASSYDLVVVQKEIFPHLPPALERLLALANSSVVVDYDDAVFASYDHKRFLKSKIPTSMLLARAVVVGNSYLAKYAKQWNRQVEIVPTVIDARKYCPKTDYAIDGRPAVIGWIGTPVTSRYLNQIAEPLRRLAEDRAFVLRCVGTPPDFSLEGVPVENVPWSEDSEGASIRSFDVGIMPLSDDPFSRGKCGLKLIQYMGSGVPSVASPVGVNVDLVRPNENGLLACSADEWHHALAAILADEGRRREMGRTGREVVERELNSEVAFARLLEIYSRCLA